MQQVFSLLYGSLGWRRHMWPYRWAEGGSVLPRAEKYEVRAIAGQPAYPKGETRRIYPGWRHGQRRVALGFRHQPGSKPSHPEITHPRVSMSILQALRLQGSRPSGVHLPESQISITASPAPYKQHPPPHTNQGSSTDLESTSQRLWILSISLDWFRHQLRLQILAMFHPLDSRYC
jgi:hypothetical protein